MCPLDVNASLFDAPSKYDDNKNSDGFDLNLPNKIIQHKLNFKPKRARGSITYTLPKIPSRMLTYDEESEKKQTIDENANLILLGKFRS